MALSGLLSGQPKRVQFIPNNGGTVITVECSIKETHVRKSPATQFPVENGGNVSDTINVQPFSLSMQGMISDTPLSNIGSIIATTAGGALQGVAGAVGVLAVTAGFAIAQALSSAKSPSVAAYGQLLNLQALRQPFSVLTTLYLYKNMFINSISVPRDAGNGNSLVFDLELVQLILVSPSTVNISIFSNPNTSASKADKGRQENLQTQQQAGAGFDAGLALSGAK